MTRVAPELYHVTLRLNAIIFVMSAIPTLSTLIVSVGQSQRHFMHCRHYSNEFIIIKSINGYILQFSWSLVNQSHYYP